MTKDPYGNKQVDVSLKRSSNGLLEGSLSLLDDVFRKETGSSSIDLFSISSGSVSRRLSEGLLGRVSKFNANPTDGDFLSPMQSHKDPMYNSISQIPQVKLTPVVRPLHPNKTLETRIKNFEENSSDRDFTKVDLRSPEEVKNLVKSSRDNQRMDQILNRYENLSEEQSQERRELASKLAARKRHRRLGCTKSEKERALLLKQNRFRLYRSGSEKILDIDVSGKINDGNDDIVYNWARAVQYDFTNFVSASFRKTEIQRKLVLGVIERSFVFAAFREYGKARCDGVLDMLVDAFEPVRFPSGHIILHPSVQQENDEFYIVERGRIDFKIDGRSVAEIDKVGGYFGELALLHSVTCERMVSVYESSSRKAKLLKINQKTFRGILNTCSKQAAQEKRDALLGVDFLHDLIDEHENVIHRLSSIMIREEMNLDDIFNLSQDSTFVVVQSGRIHVTNSNEIFESGDYFGSQALIRTLPRQTANETDMIACSEKVVFFRIDNHAMGQIVGPSRLQNLMNMRRFATTRLIKKANLSNDTYEFMADTITETKFCNDEENTWDVGLNDPPAVYIVREGSLVVSSNDKSTGCQIETLVTTGSIFGLEQLKLSMKNGKPRYRRLGGLKATIPGGISLSIGVLPLNEVKLDVKNGIISPISTKTDSDIGHIKSKKTSKIKRRHSESSILQLRAKVVEIVKSKISLQDLEKIRLLGEGEFGEVWLVAADVFCEHTLATRQKFALKSQLILDDSRSIDATDAILREIEIMKELRHSQLVDLVNTYQDETSIHMLMRLVPYGELWDRMHIEDDQGNWSSGLSDDHAKFYAMSIADTLNFIHSRGIIYRDLKPENVLIDIDGYPVIVDFGFAKFCADKTYTFVGTPNYVAPEIITNAGHNRGVDFWAFGVTVYEMVTGENPFFFEGMDVVSLYHSICHENYFRLPEDQSEEFVDFIDNILKKDPIERLGMLHGGVKDILQHQWFDGIELAQVQTKLFPAPWKPTKLICDGFENLRLEEIELSQTNDSSFSMNDSISSLSNIVSTEEKVEVEEPSMSSSSKSGEVQELNISPSTKSKTTKTKKNSKKLNSKKQKSNKQNSNEQYSNKQNSNNCGFESNNDADPSEFQFVIPEQLGVLLHKNPKVRRTPSQKKQSRIRRDLLKDSFSNFGID